MLRVNLEFGHFLALGSGLGWDWGNGVTILHGRKYSLFTRFSLACTMYSFFFFFCLPHVFFFFSFFHKFCFIFRLFLHSWFFFADTLRVQAGWRAVKMIHGMYFECGAEAFCPEVWPSSCLVLQLQRQRHGCKAPS